MIVLVTGPHRSGTSAVAGVLHHLGVFMGDPLVGADESNPWGHFEDERLVAFHEAVIGDWRSPKVNPAIFNAKLKHSSGVEFTYNELLGCRPEPWGMKDPRLCLLLGEVLSRLPEDQVRIVKTSRRHEDIVQSMVLRGEKYPSLIANPDQASNSIYIYEQAFFKQRPPDVPVQLVRYEELMGNPAKEVWSIANWLGLPVTDAAINHVRTTQSRTKAKVSA